MKVCLALKMKCLCIEYRPERQTEATSKLKANYFMIGEIFTVESGL